MLDGRPRDRSFLPLRRVGFGALFLLLMGSSSFVQAAGDGVILLHGLCRTKASMNKMAARMTDEGYVVVNVEYASRQGKIAELSEQVVGGALRDPRLKDCKTIHFVTHSLGGILVRKYFKDNPQERLGRVVMLSPPNQGSEVVDRIGHWTLFKWINGPAGGQLGTGPDSVPNSLGPVSFELGVITGDRSINWINSSMIKGNDDGKVSVEHSKVEGMDDHVVVHTSHPYVMKNRKVIALAARFLESGSFAAEEANP